MTITIITAIEIIIIIITIITTKDLVTTTIRINTKVAGIIITEITSEIEVPTGRV